MLLVIHKFVNNLLALESSMSTGILWLIFLSSRQNKTDIRLIPVLEKRVGRILNRRILGKDCIPPTPQTIQYD